MSGRVSIKEKETRVSIILSYPPTESHSSIALKTGYDREMIRRIRVGIELLDIFPEMPRIDPAVFKAKCNQCIQWEPADIIEADRYGNCALGIPECKTEGMKWARGCGAFSPIGENQ